MCPRAGPERRVLTGDCPHGSMRPSHHSSQQEVLYVRKFLLGLILMPLGLVPTVGLGELSKQNQLLPERTEQESSVTFAPAPDGGLFVTTEEQLMLTVQEEARLAEEAKIAEEARLAELARQEAEAERLRQQELARQARPSTTAQAPTPAPVYGDCASVNWAAAQIYIRESGCRTNAYNPSGCRGIGQACPGSKLTCSDDDFWCQHAWFEAYAFSRYGSWENAWAVWQRQHWW